MIAIPERDQLIMTTTNDWERIRAADSNRTVYWRRQLPDRSWLAVRRNGAGRWYWSHRRDHRAELAGSGGVTWASLVTARRHADTHLATIIASEGARS